MTPDTRQDEASNRGPAQHRRRTRLGLALATGLAMAVLSGGLWFGPVQASETCDVATPGAGDYCASSVCGPCVEGEGDCDPGQCAAGLTCVEEGAIDTCHPEDTCGTPGARDYCASSVCGPCAEGEGDCDPGQCATGLTCVEEGAIDTCQAEDSCGTSRAGDYCASSVCGPCGEGEGDCDPGQCATGLTCVEQGAIDTCQAEEACGTSRAGDYCASSVCGPCVDGEGDCDPGQCATGLTCVEEGAIDTCQPEESCGAPGAGDYCASSVCGPCAEGEGDCDPGQCATGLTCVEEGATDTCHPIEVAQLVVWHEGAWRDVCCQGGTPGLSATACDWSESGRTLTDETQGLKLDCLEGNPADCACNSVGETLHGADYGIYASGGAPLFPNYLEETCVVVDADGNLATDWSDGSCPDFLLE